MHTPDLTAAALESRRAVAKLAYDDYDTFANFVLVDEKTGNAITQSWIHEAWTQIRAQGDKAVIISFPEAGKTQQLCVGVPLWHLGRNPRLRLAIISRTQGQAADVISLMRSYIETSEELRMVFPNLRKSTAPGARWNQTQLDVQRPRGIKEPSAQAFGIDAGAITGKRVDGFVLDDVLDVRTTRTKGARENVSKKFWGEIYNRRSEAAWFLVIGNPWHPDDWYRELEARGWPTYYFPVKVTQALTDEWGLQLPLGSPTWPERWTREKIRKYEIDLPRREFERAYMVHVEHDGASPFKQGDLDSALERGLAWGVLDNVDEAELLWNIKRLARLEPSPSKRDDLLAECMRLALLGGSGALPGPRDRGQGGLYSPTILEQSGLVAEQLLACGAEWEELVMITGVDPSSGTARDPSAIVTTALARSTNERVIVGVDRGWYELPELTRRIADQWERWDSVVVFESVGMQVMGVQILEERYPEMRVERLPTTHGRKTSSTSGLPAFAHRFTQGSIAIANNGELTEGQRQFCLEATSFDPDSHPGDVLMAAWFCDHYAWHFTHRKSSNVGVQVFG